MAIEVKAVDRVLLEWLRRNADPRLDRSALEALNKAVSYFSTSSGRLGHYVAEGGVHGVLGLFNHDKLIKTMQVTEMGTLHARIESCDESVSWHNGALTLERRTHPLPETLVGALEGRKLGEIVSAPWLPANARIVHVEENRVNLVLTCDNFIVPLADARHQLQTGSGQNADS